MTNQPAGERHDVVMRFLKFILLIQLPLAMLLALIFIIGALVTKR